MSSSPPELQESKHPASTAGSFSSFAKQRRKKRLKISLIIGICLLVIAVPGFLLYRSLTAYKKILMPHTGESAIALSKNAPDIGDVKQEADSRINILLLGVGDDSHAGSLLSDTMMIASIDPQTKHVAMLSFPRDLYVPVPGRGSDKMNAAHAYGEDRGRGQGANLAKQVAGTVLDIPVHYYLRADFTGFRKMVDVLGGVSVTVPNGLSDPSYPCDYDERLACGFSIGAGTRTMNGALALKYARCRKGNCGNDFGRAARQQQVILAMRKKAMSLSTFANPAKLNSLIETAGRHIATDLSTAEMQKLYEIIKTIDGEKVESKVIDNETEKLVYSTMINGASVVVPTAGAGDFSEIANYAHNLFFDSHIVSEAVPIEVIDATGNPKLSAKIIAKLKAYRYTISNITNASAQEKTELIDYTNQEKPYSRRYIENRFKISARSAEDKSKQGFVLVLGKDSIAGVR